MALAVAATGCVEDDEAAALDAASDDSPVERAAPYPITIADGNAIFEWIDVGNHPLTVSRFWADGRQEDGENIQTWWFFRQPGGRNEPLPQRPDQVQAAGDLASIVWNLEQRGFRATLDGQVRDGNSPCSAGIAQTMTITNLLPVTQRLELFAYASVRSPARCMLPVGLSFADNRFSLTSQNGNVASFSAPTADRWMHRHDLNIGLVLTTDSVDLTNSGSPVATQPELAFQWHLELPPGASRTVTVDYALNTGGAAGPTPPQPPAPSCAGRCDSSQPVPGSNPSCFCDAQCVGFNDCCTDRAATCGS